MLKNIYQSQEDLIIAEIEDTKTFDLDSDIAKGSNLEECGVQLFERAVSAYIIGKETEGKKISQKAFGYFQAFFSGKGHGGSYTYSKGGAGLLYSGWWSENQQNREGLKKQLVALTAELEKKPTKIDRSLKEWYVEASCMSLELNNTKECNKWLDALNTTRKEEGGEVGGWDISYLRLLSNLTDNSSIEEAKKRRKEVFERLALNLIKEKYPVAVVWDLLRFLDVTYKTLGYPTKEIGFTELLNLIK